MSCSKNRRKRVVDGADVEGERRKAILAFGDQSVMNFDLGRTHIGGNTIFAAADADKGVRFLGTCCHNAAGTVIFERAAK
jgi:hypothetical protein